MSVTGGRLDLENALFDSEDGDIESTTTEIVDENLAFLLVGLWCVSRVVTILHDHVLPCRDRKPERQRWARSQHGEH